MYYGQVTAFVGVSIENNFTTKLIMSSSAKSRIGFLKKSKIVKHVLRDVAAWWSISSGNFNSFEKNTFPFVSRLFAESQTANTWNPASAKYFRHMEELRRSLAFDSVKTDDLGGLLKLLENFYTLPITKGISAFSLALSVHVELDIFSNLFQRIEKIFVDMFPDVPLDDIALERYPGGLCGLEIGEDKVVTISSFRFYKLAQDVFRLSSFSSPTILEIGGGWGGEALYRLRTGQQQKNILVDLQEMCVLQYYNLKLRFPGLKICLVPDSVSRSEFEAIIDSHDVIILSDRMLLNFSDCLHGRVNVVRNSDSFIEMTSGQFSSYLRDFPALLSEGGLVFHTNNCSDVDIDDCFKYHGGFLLHESWLEYLYEQSDQPVYRSSVWLKR